MAYSINMDNKNIKFFTGLNANNLPALSDNTVGNIYFLLDVNNEIGKVIYDSKVYDSNTNTSQLLRTVMSTEAIFDGLGNNIAGTYIKDISINTRTNQTTGDDEVVMTLTNGDDGITTKTLDIAGALNIPFGFNADGEWCMTYGEEL